MYVCVYVCLSVCLAGCLPACLAVCLSVCMYVCMYVHSLLWVISDQAEGEVCAAPSKRPYQHASED